MKVNVRRRIKELRVTSKEQNKMKEGRGFFFFFYAFNNYTIFLKLWTNITSRKEIYYAVNNKVDHFLLADNFESGTLI